MTTEPQKTASEQNLPLEQWLNTSPNFQLEDFFLTQLNLGFVPPATSDSDTSKIKYSFDYTIGIHNQDKARYRLTFRVKAHELDDKDIPVGVSLEAEIVGNFTFDANKPKDEMELLIRVNGTSVLYGILRGLVASATGAFPGGKLLLPTIMPQKIVAMVEKDRQARSEKRANAPKGKKVSS